MLNFVTVVEDDEDERTALRRLLRAGGFYVQDFGSAEAYLAAANREPLCLILDMQLVGMSGLDSSAGCEPRVQLPVADRLLDGCARDHAVQLGCVAYLRKPFQGRALVALLRELVDESMPASDSSS
jgi:FixJ family two-component response regulator